MTFSQVNTDKILQWVAYFALIAMLAGFLFNRPLNNVGLLLASLHSVWYLRQSWTESRSLLLYGLLALILYPAIHDMLFDGLAFLHPRNTMKWSLIVYPVFFVSCTRHPFFFKHTIYMIMAAMFFASMYSLVLYIDDYQLVTENYGKAQVMKVLAYSDHIRLSWATVISMIFAFILWRDEDNKKVKWLLTAYIVFQFVYLHILGAKSGLLTLYLTSFILIIGYGWKLNKKMAMVLTLSLLLSPFLAYKFIPSFYNRVSFILYDFSHYNQQDYRPGLSDAIRIYSLQGGWALFSENPWTGTGFARAQDAMNAWYSTEKPEVDPVSYFLPISQFLLYGAAGGIFGIAVILFFCISGFIEWKKNIFCLAFFIPLVVSFLYETHLENQTGVFVTGISLGLFFIFDKMQKFSR